MKTDSFGRFVIGGIFLLPFVVFGILATAHAASFPFPQKLSGPLLLRRDCVVAGNDDENPFVAYIEEFLMTDTRAGIDLYSCINWRAGFLKSEGIGTQGSSRAAEIVARGNALKTLLMVNLDAQWTLQRHFESQKPTWLTIQNVLIRNAEITELPNNPQHPNYAGVMVTIPFYGISGLTSFFLDSEEFPMQLSTHAPRAPQPDLPPNDEEYSGVLLDVRHLANMQTALFPKVVSEDGEMLYDASQVERTILQAEGMVEYVRPAATHTARRAGDAPLLIKPLLLASTAWPYPLEAQANRPKRRRKGNRLTVQATGSAGQIPVNVVVSVEDAKKIKQLHKETQIDRQGKYTILIGGEIGGVKGQSPAILLANRE